MKPTAILAFLLTVLSVHAAETIPAKTIVLTFDDAVRSHKTTVAPLLKELGFGATFFISQRWMDDQANFLSWEEAGELHGMGFEVGNHSWTHDDFSMPRNAARLAGETALVDYELAKAKAPRPVSFAYSGNCFGPEAARRLGELGYKFARRGVSPEARYNSPDPGPAFDPKKHHPLLIPTTGDAYPFWDLDHFQKVVALAVEGRAVVLQFHGVPDRAHPWVHTPPERFREYMRYLKDQGCRVLALRDLEPYIDRANPPADPLLQARYPARSEDALKLPIEMEASRADPRFWLENMLVHHRYTWDETAAVMGWSVERTKSKAAEHGVSPDAEPPTPAGGVIRALPYPGGRHPRIGFLDGAIDPQRGTKVSLFPPWKDGGYMALDLPEAIFSNLGLTYLAHTHIPTIWNRRNVTIENVDWIREADGGLRSAWKLPNGVEFGASVKPLVDGADLELWLKNGTPAKLTEMRAQICLMLKAASGFSAQDQQGKEYAKPLAVAKARDADRYVLLAFERCGRTWGNPPCPCIHSDPVLPDAEPGGRVSVRGRLMFFEGADLAGAKKRLAKSIGLATE